MNVVSTKLHRLLDLRRIALNDYVKVAHAVGIDAWRQMDSDRGVMGVVLTDISDIVRRIKSTVRELL